MSGLRLFIGLPLAAVITVGLFVVMNNLISQDIDFPQPTEYKEVIINADIQPPQGPKFPIAPIPKDLPKAPPPPKQQSPQKEGLPDFVPIAPTPPAKGPGDFIDPLPKILSPIVRIEPQYPSRCLNRGVEGETLVEFDISPQGAVINPRIVSWSDGCFRNSREILKAVSNWKYSPPGRTIRGQRTTLTFKLAG